MGVSKGSNYTGMKKNKDGQKIYLSKMCLLGLLRTAITSTSSTAPDTTPSHDWRANSLTVPRPSLTSAANGDSAVDAADMDKSVCESESKISLMLTPMATPPTVLENL